MFETIPTYDSLRRLILQNPMLQGEDVYAFQHACRFFAITVDIDGFFGAQSDKALRDIQRKLGLVVDGKGGPATHRGIAMAIADHASDEFDIPREAMEGQLEHESRFYLGRYSPARPDGSYDAGVAQRNTAHTPAEEAFKPEPSIRKLARNTQEHYFLFAGVTPKRRRWALAQGAWNAPAYACYIAREEGATRVSSGMVARPSSTARAKLEEYIANVSKYLPT